MGVFCFGYISLRFRSLAVTTLRLFVFESTIVLVLSLYSIMDIYDLFTKDARLLLKLLLLAGLLGRGRLLLWTDVSEAICSVKKVFGSCPPINPNTEYWKAASANSDRAGLRSLFNRAF